MNQRPPLTRWLGSLRTRVMLSALVVTIAPVVFVVCSPYYERVLETYLEARTDRALEAAISERSFPSASGGVHVVKVPHDGQTRVYGSSDDSALVTARAQVHRGQGRGCQVADDDRLHTCASWSTTKDGTLLYAEASDQRSVRSLMNNRSALIKLTLLVLPGALLLALWLGRRIVHPLERLRVRVQERTDSPRPRADLPVEGPDEIRDLSQSFNRLIERVVARQVANETFLQDLAHELKSPVSAVRACADRLESDEPLEEERRQRLVRVLRDSGQKFERVMNDFLELASAEAGLGGEQRSEVDLGEVIGHLLEPMRARHENLRFLLTCDSKVQCRVVSARMETALRELLVNAAHFARSEVSIRVRSLDDQVCIHVEDDGPGIPEEHLAQVFERFFTRRGGVGGTGLGLSIVRAVALAHEGDVRVLNTPGRGASFELTIPRHPRGQGTRDLPPTTPA